jgi:hypothetical protein
MASPAQSASLKNGAHPDAVFGADQPSTASAGTAPAVSYRTIAEQVRNLKPRALTPDVLDDVLTLLEFMRDECIRQHDDNLIAARKLDEREMTLRERERQVAIRTRALDVASGSSGARRRAGLMFWRK